MSARQGFSLVELSIVLVVLGLLTGGILTGQNLIRAAELRTVTSQFQGYQTATYTFRNKYFAYPGDMANATDFWGAATCPTAAGTGTATCNGDGDNHIDFGAAGQFSETFTFWQHLANAGLIEGSFTGMASSSGSNFHVAAVNAPQSRIGNGIWRVGSWRDSQSGETGIFNGNYSWHLWVGNPNGNGDPVNPILTPEEAWNIDKKIDDSMPARGNVRVRVRADCTVAPNGTVLTSSVADAAVLDAKYNLSDTNQRCVVMLELK